MKSITICTDFHVNLFGIQLLRMFEKGFTQINVGKDIKPETFGNDEEHCYFFAYAGAIPEGVKEIACNLDIFPSSINMFCNETEAEMLDSCCPMGLKAPRFKSEMDILSSFISVLELTH